MFDEEAPMKIKLFSYWRSSCSYRVRIALNFKGIEYIYMPLHLVKDGGQQHTSDYHKLNPSKQVPTLIHGETIINQSMSIFLFLDDMWAEPRLFPQDHYKKASIMDVCEIINSGIQPIQNLAVNQELKKRFEANKEDIFAWNKEFINRGFKALEHRLKDSAGKYCFGDSITAADMYLVPQVYNAERFEVDLAEFPTIDKINTNCLKNDDFAKAAPENQPDAQ